MLKVGVVGYSKQKFDAEQAEMLLKDEIRNLLLSHPDAEIEIVSGYTNLGIPGLAYKLARECGFSCTGIACVKARNYECFPCDKVIIDDSWFNWGHESNYFLDYCDMFIRIGGGAQSKLEMKWASEAGKKVITHELEAIT